MITKPIKFIQICATTDHIIGLDKDGEVFYRAKPPHDYGTSTTVTTYGQNQQKKDEAEEKRAWKKCYMYQKVDLPRGGAEREAQSADNNEKPTNTEIEVVVDEAPRKVYKDVETVKKVQAALKEKGFYKKDGNDTYKIDGNLGHLTTTAIKAFQTSLSLKETGEIDLTLWNALGLNASNIDETIIELTDEVEDANEQDFYAAYGA